ncbi:hypothetical protein SIN8267_03190 [Sinobacterium norvegicum]|uniref:DUF2889 domain-containing protein n=1 Tax=Sinobacterium norvegicum TaxID=1641715 RepID=A0ABM9AIK0_9GAMM|nr:DUF2889 domain-containing protein [Sinobacterium norvegicum]CAH0993051.1 hypothetical protein SIN8267_03190 [Sinobacterium norvegicum]
MSKLQDENPMGVLSNADYGSGVYRRRIRLQGEVGRVVAELEDVAHGFRVIVAHDGRRVTNITATVLRAPFDTCIGAVEPIKQLVGLAIDNTAQQIAKQSDIPANCTHIYDLTTLAIVHCQRGLVERVWDFSAPDERDDQPQWITAQLNGEPVLSWKVLQWTVTEPAALNGNTLYRGFSVWAGSRYQGDQAEAAFALQKAYFVSQSRRYDMSSIAGRPASQDTTMKGVCHTYSPAVIDSATRLGDTLRDFTDCPEQLLTFQ